MDVTVTNRTESGKLRLCPSCGGRRLDYAETDASEPVLLYAGAPPVSFLARCVDCGTALEILMRTLVSDAGVVRGLRTHEVRIRRDDRACA